MDEGLEALRAVLVDAGVRFALVFGSQATGRANSTSDVDVAYVGDVDEWTLRGRLPDDVDLVDLATAPTYLAGRIACEGIVLVDADPVARVRWQADMRKRHLDEQFRREQFRRDFVAAHG